MQRAFALTPDLAEPPVSHQLPNEIVIPTHSVLASKSPAT
jgi:hypothetical protein